MSGNPEDYMYSIALDYADEKGLLDNLLVFPFLAEKKIRFIKVREDHAMQSLEMSGALQMLF